MNLFSYVKSRLSIIDVIGEYTKLKQAGTYWKAHCPFHHEKTASFTVSPHKEIFYCFGCHAGGDLISFVAQAERCTQLEAAQHLIERYNIKLPEELTKQPYESTEKKHDYFNLCKVIAQYCHTMLKKSPSISLYLEQRGFTKKSIDHFMVGYLPSGLKNMKSFVAHMQTKSILLKDLLDANIVMQGKKVIYSPFEDRIIFPIKEHLGRFCGFGGRVFRKNDTRAKYYNSRENSFFSKGSLLFGFDSAKKEIQKSESLFLVEGYTDCIAMVQHGFINTVATLGTACTIEHLKLVSRHVDHLYIVYDSDNAGNKAIDRLTELCWQINVELSIVKLPQKEDPASFLHSGGDMKQQINQAEDIFIFFINQLAADFSKKPLSKKLKALEKLLQIVNNIDEPLKKDIILQNAAQSLNIPIESLRSELKKLLRKNHSKRKFTPPNKEPEKQKQLPESPDVSYPLEKKILFAIINDVSLLNKDNEDYLIACLPNPLGSIVKKVKKVKEQQRTVNVNFSSLYKLLDQQEKLLLNKVLFQQNEKIGNQSFGHLLQRFKNKTWKIVAINMKQKLATAEQNNDTKEVEKLLHNFSKLKKALLHKNVELKNNE